jgi:hypothetical protein
VVPATQEGELVDHDPKTPRQKCEILSGKQANGKRTRMVAQVVSHLLSKHEALS